MIIFQPSLVRVIKWNFCPNILW